MSELLTPKEVGERFKVSARTVANWLKKGLPHFKLGRTVRVSPADIDLWITKNKRTSLSPLTPELVAVLHGEPLKAVFSAPRCRKPKATSLFL